MSYIMEARESYRTTERLFENETGLTSGQYLALKALAESEEPLICRAITERVPVDRSTLSDILKRLADGGYVILQPSREDKRAKLVKITRKGRGAFLKAQAYDRHLSRSCAA